jgi:pimeloyl-ACP methyl ester carboxylesterase
MMRFFKWFFLISFCFFISPSHAFKAAESIDVHLVRLQTADGLRLTGILRRPSTAKIKACVILIHGYGGNFYSGIMDFLPKALTDREFATFVPNMRDHDRTPKKNRFEENRYDIATAVDKMDLLGYDSIFLYGHSMGTNRVLYYVAATQDPRIKGILLTGPPGNLFEWNIRVFGSETANSVLHEAQALVSKGKGDEWMLINLGPLGKALYTAKHVVSLRGPESVSDPYKNIARVHQPILIVHGLNDRLANPDVADRLRNSATAKENIAIVKIPGANHQFRNHQKKLVNVLTQWMIEHLNH